MSSPSCLLTEEQLLCGVCLDVFTEPVTLPCGHNFCHACITQHWDSSSHARCPTCKESFTKRLSLRVNTVIADMAAQFRQSSGGGAARVAAPGDVGCDICTESKLRAVKSCLVCLASYCKTHLEPHLTSAPLKRHQLTEPVENLEGRMCSIHDKPLELFCRTDQACVCMLCPVLDHKSHHIVPLKEQFEREKAELGRREAHIHRSVQERRLKIQEIKHSLKLSRDAAEREKADGVQIFGSLIRSLERAQAELVGEIEAEQKAAEEQADGLVRELEREISELLRTRAEVERLARSKDHLHFLQGFAALSESKLSRDWSEVSVEPPSHDGAVKAAVDRLEETLGKEMMTSFRKVELNRLRQFAVDLTLDPDTAHPALVLSDDGKRVHHAVLKKNLPDSPQRFNPSCCVLAKQGFASGRFYFEARVKGKTRWTLGVAKASIKRKGIIPLCPDNGHWTVWLKNGYEYSALVGSPLPLTVRTKPHTVGVFVDYEDGLVSFYDVGTAELLYSFASCSFTEKLYPFFSPGLNNDGANATPVVIATAGLTDAS